VTALSLLPLAAATLSILLALASVVRKKPTVATWCFFAGMVLLAADSLVTAIALRAPTVDALIGWLKISFVVKAAATAVWLAFSVSYSRGDSHRSLRRWAIPIALAAVLPLLAVWYRNDLVQVVSLFPGEARLQYGQVAKLLNLALLVVVVLVMLNIEQTFRSAVGTMRWRIKFVVLAMVVIFGARLYVRAQVMLFNAPEIGLWAAEAGSLLIGCVFLAAAYMRTGLSEIDVYPSVAVLRSSLTLLLVGAYLFILGILVQVAQRYGGAESFQIQAFLVLLGVSGLGLLLLSDRARKRIQLFAVRHFRRARHDSRQLWTTLSKRLAHVKDERELCETAVKMLCESFDVLSASAWLTDARTGHLSLCASSSQAARDATGASPAVSAGLQSHAIPFDLEDIQELWAKELRRANPSTFPHGGHRWCVPLRTADQVLGVIVLGDRVNGVPYTLEELEILGAIAEQLTSVLLNLRLASELASAREFEAFRTMSTFFVHDLKNAAASLNLMLRNLPVHFDDPEFRADALRGIGNTTRRIEEMIERLSTFREGGAVRLAPADLNRLVQQSIREVEMSPDVRLSTEFGALPTVQADAEQIKSVVINLLTNARESLNGGGEIRVSTRHHAGRAEIAVGDNGDGMTPAFVEERLFRPFQSTKKKGLGIGLFQCRAIVQAHGGAIQVASEPGKGTTFTITLPVTRTS
jgi:putative PEP-CTERM system histidine kinase